MKKARANRTHALPGIAWLRAGAAASMLMALSGCVSLGGAEPPESLLTITPELTAPAGSAVSAEGSATIALHEPSVPAEIDALRVPVQIDDANLAYLQDAVWVERPAQLFRRLLAETIRVRSERVVLKGGDPAARAGTHLRGHLSQFGYDASRSAAVVRFDATILGSDGLVRQQRFEAIEEGVLPEAGDVGAALNRAANEVARQVADWAE
jgi:cholesterol transport system auxiliary component